MKITEISIKNFRSFDERGASIVVGEMAAFVGKNSSGKSNILQALQLFWGQYALTAEDFYYGETDRTISISVTFAVSPDEILPFLLPYVSRDGYLQLRHDYTEADIKGKLYSRGRNIYTGQADMNPFPERKLTPVKISTFLASEQSAELRTYAQDIGKPLDERSFYDIVSLYWCANIQSFSNQWNAAPVEISGTNLKNLLSVLPPYYYLPVSYTTAKLTQDKHSYFQQIYQQILGDIQQLRENAQAEQLKQRVAALYRAAGIHKRCSDINQLLSETGGADSSVKMHIEIGEPNYDVLFHPAPSLRVDDGYDCDVQAKGQGIQRDAIFRLLKVFSRLSKNQQKQFILAVDEPEAFMHPTYKRSLFKSFLALCAAGCQVMYTTHDPAFVSVSRFDDIHTVAVVKGQKQYTTVFSSSFAEIMQKEVFRRSCRCKVEESIRKELEHKCQGEQNEGFFADRIILVEGPTESYALPVYFARLGYDLDENNTVILRAQSKTLLQLLCAIFSSCRIPCYCIFDGDKPEEDLYARYMASQPLDDGERSKIKDRSKLNRNLLAVFHGVPQDFPDTTIGYHYTVWERDFEHAVQMHLRNFEELRAQIIKQEGVSSESKPLIAYHLAVKSKLSDLPPAVQSLLVSLVERIKICSCLPLADVPRPTNTFTLYPDEIDDAVPVYASAAGRNTLAEDDTPISYATGTFPTGTSYLVHIQGDSMANQIPDGCYVAVKQVEEWPRPGTIGIFLINDGEMVCKQYIEKPNGEKLLKSLNRSHRSIRLTEDIYCQVRGEVVMLGRKQPAIFFTE